MTITDLNIDGYIWAGVLGAWFKSRERRRHVGDVRVIRGRLFAVNSIYRRYWCKPEVNWTPVDTKLDSYEEIRKFHGIIADGGEVK